MVYAGVALLGGWRCTHTLIYLYMYDTFTSIQLATRCILCVSLQAAQKGTNKRKKKKKKNQKSTEASTTVSRSKDTS